MPRTLTAASVVSFAAVGMLLVIALTARGFAPDAAALLDGHGLLSHLARVLAPRLGDAGAIRATLAFGVALSCICLSSVGAEVGLAFVLLAAPLTTGIVHGDPAVVCLGPAVLALQAWGPGPGHAVGRAVALTAFVGLISPVAGAALAVAGFVLRPNVAAFVLAPLLASLGEPGAADSIGFATVRTLLEGGAAPATVGVALAVALIVLGGSWRLRAAGLVAVVFAVGPLVVVPREFGRILAIPLPALPFALCGAEADWSGAGVVAAAVLVLLLADSPRGRLRFLALGLVAAEGLLLTVRLPSPLPARTPEAVRSLAERTGVVLHLPVSRSIRGEPARAPLWRHEALFHGRELYQGARGVRDADPVLGEPGVVAVVGLLEPTEGWLIPQSEPGSALRSLGITELVLDRAALAGSDLARLDPVLARLYGPPQRDNAGRIDLWRIDASGKRGRAPSPYLRRKGEPGTDSWRTLEELLSAGRQPG